MNNFRELWIKKNSGQGKINITIFFINIFLFLCHVFLMFIYCFVNHKFMIVVNIISLFIYASSLFFCYKKPNIYIHISFIEIWTHMFLAVLSYGLAPCFQNWIFALIIAYFFPISKPDSRKRSCRQSLIFATILIFTYFAMTVIINIADFKILQPLSSFYNRILFVFNNLCSFAIVVILSLFYTSRINRKEMELSRKADYDELTNLYNRYALNQLSKNILYGCKCKKCFYNVAILDIDFFKRVNDKYGHNAGDLVLKNFAEILKSISTEDLIVGRWGGEEFVAITTHNIKYQDFIIMLDKLRVKVSKYKFKISDRKSINITISIGCANIKNQKDLECSIKEADKNLYEAKNTGRNKVVG